MVGSTTINAIQVGIPNLTDRIALLNTAVGDDVESVLGAPSATSTISHKKTVAPSKDANNVDSVRGVQGVTSVNNMTWLLQDFLSAKSGRARHADHTEHAKIILHVSTQTRGAK